MEKNKNCKFFPKSLSFFAKIWYNYFKNTIAVFLLTMGKIK